MIYVIENQSREVKIGYTKDAGSLRRRMSALRTGSADNLKLMATGEGSQPDEQKLHALLEQFHVRGEWFSDEGWMDPLMGNVIALLPLLGAHGILAHTEANLRGFVAFPRVRGPKGYVDYPERWAGVRIADLKRDAA